MIYYSSRLIDSGYSLVSPICSFYDSVVKNNCDVDLLTHKNFCENSYEYYDCAEENSHAVVLTFSYEQECLSDMDGDEICDTDDECPNDPTNNPDNDEYCDDIDPCVGEYDECGVCNGDGTDCAGVAISFGSVGDASMEINIDTPVDVGGFQFDVLGTRWFGC